MLHQNSQNSKKSKRSNLIPIPTSVFEKHQYSLKQNFFDPTKSSPPNNFIKNLFIRLSHYDSSTKNSGIFDNK